MPKGFGVKARIWFKTVGILVGRRGAMAISPKPPLLDTAAASSRLADNPIGALMMGTSIPNRSQSGVRIIFSPYPLCSPFNFFIRFEYAARSTGIVTCCSL